MREKPRKSRRFGFQNRVRGPFERASRAQKRPVRAKKFARSACGASENLKVSANESTSSEQERLQAAKTRAPPEAPEAFFGNFEMDVFLGTPSRVHVPVQVTGAHDDQFLLVMVLQ